MTNQRFQNIHNSPFKSVLALDFVVVIFFKNEKKKCKWWSDPVLRKIWLGPMLSLFAKNIYLVKITSSKSIISELVLFLHF